MIGVSWVKVFHAQTNMHIANKSCKVLPFRPVFSVRIDECQSANSAYCLPVKHIAIAGNRKCALNVTVHDFEFDVPPRLFYSFGSELIKKLDKRGRSSRKTT